MRLYPYLCGMKTIKLITLTAFFFCLNIPLHAQFNTIGSINNKRIYTTNPPKPKEVLTDSIVVADNVPDSTTTDNDGDGQTIVTSSDNHNLMSLVALPLETIHINSGFGMRRHPIYHKRIMHNGIDLSAKDWRLHHQLLPPLAAACKRERICQCRNKHRYFGQHGSINRATSASDDKKGWQGF